MSYLGRLIKLWNLEPDLPYLKNKYIKEINSSKISGKIWVSTEHMLDKCNYVINYKSQSYSNVQIRDLYKVYRGNGSEYGKIV